MLASGPELLLNSVRNRERFMMPKERNEISDWITTHHGRDGAHVAETDSRTVKTVGGESARNAERTGVMNESWRNGIRV